MLEAMRAIIFLCQFNCRFVDNNYGLMTKNFSYLLVNKKNIVIIVLTKINTY